MSLVMVVDDSRTVRMSIEYLLKTNGYEVCCANDGQDGLNKLQEMTQQQKKPGLILTDINMPNMGGLEFVAEVKKIPAFRFTPILVLTTESQDNMKLEGKKAGAAGWIVKPYKPEQLVAVVKKFV